MDITLRQIEIFLNVVDIGHLTQVSKDMNLSQSAISMSIKELENAIGRPLFDRINKRLTLNEVGRSFHQEIKPAYRKMLDIQTEFQSSPNKGNFRVGASTTIVDYIMPQIAGSYMENYPEVKITLSSGNTQSIVDKVKEGLIDVGFIECNINDHDIIKEKVGVDELVIVTGSLEMCTNDPIEIIASQKWILQEKGSGARETFLSSIKNRVDCINIFMELTNIESIKSALQNKNSYAGLSKIAVNKEIQEKKLFRVDVKDFECNREFFMIYHKNKFKSGLFEKFTFFAKKMIAQMLDGK